MGNRIKKMVWIAAVLLVCAGIFAGCQKKEETKKAEEKSGEESTPEETKKDVIVDGKDNLQVKGTMEGMQYTSESGNITIILPDESWKCESDVQDGITFSSGNGIITILRMDGSEAVESSIFHNQEEYLSYLKGTTPNLQGDVVSFDTFQKDGRECFRAVFHYTGDMEFKYMVSEGISFSDHCYAINGMLYTEDEAVMNGVRTSIENCRITE